MARKLFEEQGLRIRRGPLARAGTVYVVYTDAAGTALADISATSGGSAIPGSAVAATDIDGLGPAAFRFYGPPDGTDTLYLRCPSDTSLGVQEIEADADERLDALEGGGGGGGAHPDLATHDALGLATDAELTTHAADTTAVHGITDTATLATSSSVTSAVSTHEAAANPHPAYATDTDLSAHETDTSVHGIADTTVLATDAEVTSAVSGHAAAADPHGDRAYADAVAQGLDVKAAVQVASTGALTLSGEQTIDGVLTSASRVLVKNQAAGADNGIYVSAAGAWARAADADTGAEVDGGTFVFVESGTVNGGTGWAQTADPVTLGTTPLVFSQFSAGGTIIGGAGLVKTGNTLDVGAGTGLTVAADTVGITPGGVTNTEVNAAAGIAESKLALNFPTHAEDHAARHAAAGADPLTGYATSANLATHEGAVDPHGGYVLESAHTSAAHDALGLATDAELATHEADTTVVHGIADTSKVALKPTAADRVLYVSTTGSDSNDGLSAGSAKLTVQAALTALASTGGTVNVLGGVHTQTTELVAPVAPDRPIRLVGQGHALSGAATTLRWTADLGSGKFGIRPTTAGGSYNYLTIEQMRLLGPNNTVAYGSFPALMDGVQMGRKTQVRDCTISGFRAGIKIVADHNRIERVIGGGNGYSIYWADMPTYGDHIIYDSDLSGCWVASLAVAPTASVLGCAVYRCHLGFGPYSVLLESGRDPTSTCLGTVVFHNTSFETAGNGHVISPDLTAKVEDCVWSSVGTWSLYDSFAISGQTAPARIQVGTLSRGQFISGFHGRSGDRDPTTALFIANTMENNNFDQGAFRTGIQVWLDRGVVPFQAKLAQGNWFRDGGNVGVITKASSVAAVTAGQLVGWASTGNRAYVRPYASAFSSSADAKVLGVAWYGGPAVNETTLSDCTVVLTEGDGVVTNTAAATPAGGTYLMADATDRNRVAVSDGRLDLPVPGFASGNQSGTVSGTNVKVDLRMPRPWGLRRKTVTGSRGGNAALADLLTQLSALGIITDSSSA